MTRVFSPGLTGGRLLARNVLWNLSGQLLPLVVAILAAPLLIRGLGVERFGLLSIAWMVIGYFSLFDLGLGRALTKLVADRFAEGRENTIGSVVWTALLFLAAMGILGTLVTWALTPWLCEQALRISVALRPEASWSFYALGAAIPLVTLTSGLRGVLEAGQHFSAATLIRVPTTVLMFVVPLMVLPFSTSLIPVVVGLVLVRFAAALLHLFVCLRLFPSLRANTRVDAALVRPVLQLGGWMTVTNVVGPVMMYLDRFFIASILTVSAVTYYAAPFDVITRFLVVPIAVVGVLFPAFASSLASGDDRATLLLGRGAKYVFFAVLPILVVTVSLAPEGLSLWLGPTFAENSTATVRWLAVGVLANGLSQVPFAFVQAAGRPDLTAKLHVAELPLYLVALWLLTASLGITGTAIAWTARSTIDGFALFAIMARIHPPARTFLRDVLLASASSAMLLAAAALPMGGISIKVTFVAVVLAAIAVAGWRSLTREERKFVMSARAALR